MMRGPGSYTAPFSTGEKPLVAIASYDRDAIMAAVIGMYTDVATAPQRGYHFPTGRAACEKLGYPADLLERLAPGALESFAGVGYPFLGGWITSGDTLLDVGAGAGTDSLLAAVQTGSGGRVYALDLTPAMLDKLRGNARAMGCTNLFPVCGNAEQIPLSDASIDVVISNGVFNLVPDKQRAFHELHRVLRSGGRLQISDIVIRTA